MKKLVDDLAILEEVARTAAAANAVSPKSGRPPLLSNEDIQRLAYTYKQNTGSKPGRGSGPFAEFVAEVITALNPAGFKFSNDSVIDAIKNAHHQYKPSQFSD
jgi:hypothetical protein